MKKCLHCNKIYNDDWYACTDCGEVLVNYEGEDTEEEDTEEYVESDDSHEDITNSQMPKFSILPSIFYATAAIIIICGLIAGISYIAGESEISTGIGLAVLFTSFTSALIFIGFGKIIGLLDIIKWK